MGSERLSTTAPAAAWSWARLLLWLGLLVGAITLLGAAAGGPLRSPGADPAGWVRWAADRDALTAVFALLRLGVLAVAWYLLVVTLLGTVARILRRRRLVALADIVTVPGVRRLLRSVLGASLATSMTATAPLVAAAAPLGQPPAISVPLETEPPAGASPDPGTTLPGGPPGAPFPATRPPSPPGPVDVSQRDAAPASTASHARAPDGHRASVVPLPSAGAPAGGSPADRSVPQGHDALARTWTVAPGEHFWSKAEQVLAERLGAEPAERVVAAYWTALVAANRDRLVDPGNPDLILPGQTFVLPAFDPRGRSP